MVHFQDSTALLAYMVLLQLACQTGEILPLQIFNADDIMILKSAALNENL